ncbi:hypothetical protein LXL04_030130 [Taraxacum kok-saghyz]
MCDGWGSALYKSKVVKAARGAAMILANNIKIGETIIVEPNVIPTSAVTYAAGIHIKQYLNSTSSPVASIIYHGTVYGVNTAPQVASFSSRGPNLAGLGILKPDIIGPEVNIFAAWPESIDFKKPCQLLASNQERQCLVLISLE